MKNLDVSAYGVVEMRNAEIHGTDGGFWAIIGAIAGAILVDIVLNPSAAAKKFCEGIEEGLNCY